MNLKGVQKAELAAREFLKRAKEWRQHNADNAGYTSSRKGGALRRSSMELSRALTEARRPAFYNEKD